MPNSKYDLPERQVDFAGDTAIFCKKIPNEFTRQYYGQRLLRLTFE